MKKILGLYMIVLVTLFATDCNKNDQTTYGLMDCQKVEIEKYTKVMNRYFTKALLRQEDKELIKMMKESQNMWVSYEDAECRAVYQKWIHGTIRGLMAGSCTIEMIKQRTHKIWEEYLLMKIQHQQFYLNQNCRVGFLTHHER